MKNVLSINGQKHFIEDYYDFASALEVELDIAIEDFETYDEAKQTKILQAFEVSTVEELDKIDTSEFNLNKVVEILGNLDITFYYMGEDFDGQIDSMYIDEYLEPECETADPYAYNGVKHEWFY